MRKQKARGVGVAGTSGLFGGEDAGAGDDKWVFYAQFFGVLFTVVSAYVFGRGLAYEVGHVK
eukprot:3067252-Rhodomonas_salina.1